MAQQALLSTVSVDVTIDDLGGLFFSHPTVDQDLIDSPMITRREELAASDDLQSALDGNLITITDENGVSITDVSIFFDRIKNNHSATIDPTVNDDETAGYTTGSHWINTTPNRKFFVCASATVGAADWIEVQEASGLLIQQSYFANTTAYKEVSSTTYEAVGHIRYPGTDAGVSDQFVAIMSRSSAAGSSEVRMVDIDNGGAVIAEITGITAPGIATYITTGITNLPAAAAIFEVQVRKGTSGSGKARVHYVSL